MSFSLSNSSQKLPFFAVLMYALYGHPRYFKFKWKQYGSCFQTIFPFFMTMMWSSTIIRSQILTLMLILLFSVLKKVSLPHFCCQLGFDIFAKSIHGYSTAWPASFLSVRLDRDQSRNFADIFLKFYWPLTAYQNSR